VVLGPGTRTRLPRNPLRAYHWRGRKRIPMQSNVGRIAARPYLKGVNFAMAPKAFFIEAYQSERVMAKVKVFSPLTNP